MAAISQGRPIITTAPALPSDALVHGETMWFVPTNDDARLANGIKLLMNDPELRRRLGESSAELAGRFSWDAISRQTISFINSLDDPRIVGA